MSASDLWGNVRLGIALDRFRFHPRWAAGTIKAFCEAHGIPVADICALLHDEHFGDELHPNDRGAQIIAEAVFQVLRMV